MSEPYEGWAIVELMGHRRLAGRVSEAEQYGTAMLRLDVPAVDGQQAATQFYGGSAIYCVTPTDEEAARLVAARNAPAPIQTWELPRPRRDETDDVDVEIIDEDLADPSELW
ncbi:MAG TPA: hypothetical protein VGR26_14820 [Acidimicrobiales bacterium]|nr:hypothetical protein [Acidimicrobiales bacterium]